MKVIKSDYDKCKISKRIVEVSLGPVSTKNMTITLVFHYTQFDWAGAFKAYTLFNQCKIIKVRMHVFYCTTTTAIIKSMKITAQELSFNHSSNLRAKLDTQRNFFWWRKSASFWMWFDEDKFFRFKRPILFENERRI